MATTSFLDPGENLSGSIYNNIMPAAPTGGFVSPESMVSNQLSSIIKKDSPLQDLAQARSLEQANQAGMAGSTMAIGAGQKALYDSATPLAMSQADRYGTSDLSKQDAYQDLRQTGVNANVSQGLAAQQEAIQSGLSKQGFTQETALTGQRGDISSMLQEQQDVAALGRQKQAEKSTSLLQEANNLATKQRQLAAELAQAKLQGDQNKANQIIQAQNNLATQQRQTDAQLAQSKLQAQQDQATLLRTQLTESETLKRLGIQIGADTNVETMKLMGAATDTYAQRLIEIQQIPNEQLSAAGKTTLINQLNAATKSTVTAIASLGDVSVNWTGTGATTVGAPLTPAQVTAVQKAQVVPKTTAPAATTQVIDGKAVTLAPGSSAGTLVGTNGVTYTSTKPVLTPQQRMQSSWNSPASTPPITVNGVVYYPTT